MTIYEKLITYDEEQMAKFLLAFSRDTINQLARNEFPSINSIIEFLERELPE